MKTHLHLLLVTFIACTITSAAHAVSISDGGFLINKPGKYKLLDDIAVRSVAGSPVKFGIAIRASNVDLDLGGFTIGPAEGAPNEGFAILLGAGVKRVRIHDGRIARTFCGVQSVGESTQEVILIERVQVDGCASYGFGMSAGNVYIRGCSISNVPIGGGGIELKLSPNGFAEVVDCTLHGLGGNSEGISSEGTNGLIVRNCRLFGLGKGIIGTPGCKIIDNFTLGCSTPFSGNPVMLGINN